MDKFKIKDAVDIDDSENFLYHVNECKREAFSSFIDIKSFCRGLCWSWWYLRQFQSQQKYLSSANSQKQSKHKDYDRMLDLLEKHPFTDMLYLIKYFSYIDEYTPWNGNVLNRDAYHDYEDDIPRIIRTDFYLAKKHFDTLNKDLQITENKKLIKEYAIGSLFTIEQIKQLLGIEGLIKEGRIIIFESSDSDKYSALFKEDGQYFYFNDCMGAKHELQTRSIGKVVKMICEHHPRHLGVISQIKNLTKCEKYFPLGLKIFAFYTKEGEQSYPNATDILTKINPVGNAQNCSSLDIAASIGSLDSVKYFLNKGANPNIENENGITPLMIAAGRGDIAIVEELILSEADSNIQNKDGDAALLFAVRHNHPRIVEMLLMARANPNVQNLEGQVPLVYATICGYTEVVKAILITRANINIQHWNDLSAIVYAAKHKRTEIVKLFIEAKFDVNAQDYEDGRTPLIYASRSGNIEIFKMLLEAGADLDIQDKEGTTALMMACINDHVEIVKELIKHGAKTDVRDQDGWTVLMLAAEYNSCEPIKALLDAGVDPNLTAVLPAFRYETSFLEIMSEKRGLSCTEIAQEQKERGKTPKVALNNMTAIKIAAYKDNTEAVKTLSADARVDVDVMNSEGRSALELAAEGGSVECLNLLLKKGRDPNVQDDFGNTALMLAAMGGHVGAIRMLLVAGANPNLQDNGDVTALMFAIGYNRLDIVKVILENKNVDINIRDNENASAIVGAVSFDYKGDVINELLSIKNIDIDVQDKDGLSALMIAAENNNTKAIEMLLDNSANTNLQDKEEWTALMYAANNGNIEVVKKLLTNKNLDLGIKNNNGKTALDLAATDEVKELLQKHTVV